MGPRSWRQASRLRRCSFLLCHRQRPAWATQPGPQHPHRPSLIPGERGQEGPFCPVPWLQRWHCPCPACLPLALPGRAAPMVQGWQAGGTCSVCELFTSERPASQEGWRSNTEETATGRTAGGRPRPGPRTSGLGLGYRLRVGAVLSGLPHRPSPSRCSWRTSARRTRSCRPGRRRRSGAWAPSWSRPGPADRS